MAILCLDIGGTKTSARLDDGKTVAGPAGALSLGAAQAETAIREVWAAAKGSHPPKTDIFAGIAGISLTDVRLDLLERLSDFRSVTLMSDGYPALIAATKGAPGALISVGTGVTGLALNADGTTRSVSGWGFPAGDIGGGSWIGRRAFADALRHFDGMTLTPDLPPMIREAVLGLAGPTEEDVMAWNVSATPGDFAKLAPTVLDLGPSDPYANALLTEAGAEIAALAHALNAADPVLTGGLASALIPYCTDAAPDIHWKTGAVDPLAGLRLIATGKAPREMPVKRL